MVLTKVVLCTINLNGLHRWSALFLSIQLSRSCLFCLALISMSRLFIFCLSVKYRVRAWWYHQALCCSAVFFFLLPLSQPSCARWVRLQKSSRTPNNLQLVRYFRPTAVALAKRTDLFRWLFSWVALETWRSLVVGPLGVVCATFATTLAHLY